MAQSFIPNPCFFKEVNHKDENIFNNIVQNLEWCDRVYNNNYGHRNQKVSTKLSIPVRRISEITKEINAYTSMHDASDKTGLSLSYICNLCNKKKKQEGYIWEKCEWYEKNRI